MGKFIVPNFASTLPFMQQNSQENITNATISIAEIISKQKPRKHHNKLSKRLREGKKLFRL